MPKAVPPEACNDPTAHVLFEACASFKTNAACVTVWCHL